MRIVVQPQFDLQTGQMVGTEALARGTNSGPEILPEDFLPEIIEADFERDLFEPVLVKAMGLIGELHRRAVHCPISINASANVLSNRVVLKDLGHRFKSSRLPAQLIKIEMTEVCSAPDLDLLVRQLLRLFCISVDDFGVGRSSMERLVRLPFSELNIDRMFTREMEHRLVSSAMV